MSQERVECMYKVIIELKSVKILFIALFDS